MQHIQCVDLFYKLRSKHNELKMVGISVGEFVLRLWSEFYCSKIVTVQTGNVMK